MALFVVVRDSSPAGLSKGKFGYHCPRPCQESRLVRCLWALGPALCPPGPQVPCSPVALCVVFLSPSGSAYVSAEDVADPRSSVGALSKSISRYQHNRSEEGFRLLQFKDAFSHNSASLNWS